MQKIYSVIHAANLDQVMRNIERTVEAGADGTFVINHAGIGLNDLYAVPVLARDKFPNLYIGINPLGLAGDETFKMAADYGFDALWLDDAYVRATKEMNTFQEALLEDMDEARKAFKGQYFGSVAFKTHGLCSDPVEAALNAIGHMDVVTTSGPGTAQAPEVSKIAAMKAAIGSVPLAIASGMSPENIQLFSMADAILVASGVQDTWTELNTAKLKLMVERKAGDSQSRMGQGTYPYRAWRRYEITAEQPYAWSQHVTLLKGRTVVAAQQPLSILVDQTGWYEIPISRGVDSPEQV